MHSFSFIVMFCGAFIPNTSKKDSLHIRVTYQIMVIVVALCKSLMIEDFVGKWDTGICESFNVYCFFPMLLKHVSK